MTFGTAAPNGAPVEYYTVYANGAPHQCPASPCTITGLANGTAYDRVRHGHQHRRRRPAERPASQASPNAVPDQVTGTQDRTSATARSRLTWQPAHVDGSPVTATTSRSARRPPGEQQIRTSADRTTHTFTGLVNGTTLHVQRAGGQRLGQRASGRSGVTAVPFGKPLTMAAPAATGAPVPDPATTRAIR